MKQITLLLVVAFFVFSCNSNKQQRAADTFYMPAEWGQHDAVWLITHTN